MAQSKNPEIDALMEAARIKLEAQQKEQQKEQGVQQETVPQDIYADMRQEMDIPEENYIQADIKHGDTDYGDDNIVIQHHANDESEIELDPNDPPLFEDGPGSAQVEIWKKQYTQEKVMHTQIIDRHFVFRTLNRFEYKQIIAIENIDALYREELICKTCVLWPYNYDFKTMAKEDSGYPSTLAQIIMENSGFTKEYGIEIL